MEKLIVVHRDIDGAPARFGVSMLMEAAQKRGIALEYKDDWNQSGSVLVAGLATNRLIARMLKRENIQVENKPEGVLLAGHCTEYGNKVAVAAGTDKIGLMYALCEMAERIADQGLPALNLKFELTYPAISVRTAGRFIQSTRDDGWFFSREFWEYYLARLSQNRINRLQLITGMDTAYMSPPYPFLVKTPGYEQVVAAVGEDHEKRREDCLSMLRYIGNACHEHGIMFCFGIWQQKPWTQNQKTLVMNCPQEDQFSDYAQKSVAQLLLQCPEIDALSFRVNLEAGVRSKSRSGTAQDFWFGMVDAIKGTGRKISLELRAKGLTDEMIDYAVKTGLNVTVPTKAWCEHVALPYQMLQMRAEELAFPGNVNSSRRYSYDDLLRRPRAYDMHYRLWNYGSTNLLLWGQPYHVSRFIASCLKAQATGFEFTAPLSLKGGHAMIPGDDWPIHISPGMIHYKFEDERYWMWYRAYGRMSYNPSESRDVWMREMRARFGAAAEDMEQAYLSSGKILPLITTAHFPEHPSMHYWPELYSGAALFVHNNDETYFMKENNPSGRDSTYYSALPSDEALFCSIETYVDGEIAGSLPECYSPLEVADWYNTLAENTLHAILRLQESGLAESNREIRASLVDFSMLQDLARYHAFMVHAAYHLCRFQKTGDKAQLAPAYKSMYLARSAFARLSVLGTKYYARNLEFDAGTSTRRNGNWQDRLEHQVEADLQELGGLLKSNGLTPTPPSETETYQSLLTKVPFAMSFTDNVPSTCKAGHPLSITLRPGFMEGLVPCSFPVVHYRKTNLREGAFIRLPMRRAGEAFEAEIPGAYITTDYDLYIYFTLQDAAGNILLHPGVYHADFALPVHVITVE
jgi:hypothetical protein